MPRVCTASASASTDVHAASWYNTTGAAANVYAIVDSASTAGGQFDLAFTTSAPINDDICSLAMTTLAPGTVMHNLNGFFSDYQLGTGCAPVSGADRLYRVQIPPNQRFTAAITPVPDAGFDPALNLVNGPVMACETMHTCSAAADRGARNEPDTLVFNNYGAAFDGYLKVSDYNGVSPLTLSTDFTLTTSLTAIPTGEACQVPQPITPGTLTAQTNVDFTADTVFDNADTSCEDTTGVADRVYSISVPNGQTLTVTVTPPAGMDGGTGNQNIGINIIDSPATSCSDVMSCLGSANAGGAGVTETATYMNATGAAKTVFVQVVSLPAGTFTVNVQLQ
jgi:hypothetical protein